MQKEHPFAYEKKMHKLNKRRENWSKLISIHFWTYHANLKSRCIEDVFDDAIFAPFNHVTEGVRGPTMQ